MDYRIVIGLEIHVQLLTRTKLFCGCRTTFGLPPNSATCPVCLGLPGSLPVMNRRAFELALRAAIALDCEIAPFTKWDRKNYFYPDLPKNYQISQYDLPFSRNGHLDIEASAGVKRIGIVRVHLEDDAGKMVHGENGVVRGSLVDLNRAGTPLMEIVSKPELSSPEEARIFLEEIRLMMRELEVSDCEMQEGSLRCDANVNIHVDQGDGTVAPTPIVEVKNLNSFRAVERAMKYEAERQVEEFRRTGTRMGDVPKATAGWDESRGVTVVQRRKEEAADYRYFPEPDLVPVSVDDAWKQQVRSQIGELPAALRRRLQDQYELGSYEAGVISRKGRAFAHYFEVVARMSGDAKAASNWLVNQVMQSLNESNRSIGEFPLSPEALAGLIKQIQHTGMNMHRSRDVYARMLNSGVTAERALADLGIQVIADEDALRAIVRRAVDSNPKAVADYRKGKTKAVDAIKGAVMRETKGMAKTELVQKFVLEEITRDSR